MIDCWASEANRHNLRSFFVEEGGAVKQGLTVCILCLASILLGAIPSVAEQAGNDARRRFVEEYNAASRELQSFYANSRIKVRTWEVGSSSGADTSSIWEFAGNGNLLRCIRNGDLSTPPTAWSVVVANPELSFRLTKKPDAREFSIITMGPAPPKTYDGLRGMIRSRVPPHSAAFCFLDMSVSDFMADKSFFIKDVRERSEDGRVVSRVSWSCRLSDSPEQEGWFDFLPEKSWALIGYDRTIPHTDPKTKATMLIMAHARMTYDEGQGAIPRIQKVEEWGSGPGGKGAVTTSEVTEFTPGPVPASEFGLEAFGIRTRPAPTSVPAIYYILALSGLCGLGALVFRWLQHRTTRPTPVG